ncbi:hypothetical protein [Polaribacter porphyrae]|uniref:Uncharacterized protein n=1 Tax=Polaribacter porphyrae TaxID=1137780 RepID=A0A2S7WLK8_9FLAO|nr:hypothetical protein [Polaribacter porphyrae]PQJ78453.1 hypothetical protein BTO18_04275 [Polaribacter porphyrae]
MLLSFYKITFLKAFASEFIDYTVLTIAFFLLFMLINEFFGKPRVEVKSQENELTFIKGSTIIS